MYLLDMKEIIGYLELLDGVVEFLELGLVHVPAVLFLRIVGRADVVRPCAVDAEREFEELYTQSYGLVYAYVRASMRSDAAAEDIVAEAYLKAARAFDRFDPARAKFSTWVVTIARNCMISHYRREQPVVAIDDISQSLASVDGEQDAVDDCDLVRRLLAILDDDERELVLMNYREDMRNVEIAETLEMNPSTVATNLSRALAKMRAYAERSRFYG